MEREIVVKKLILVTSPPASGKTFVSRRLAEKLGQIVYIDKDSLIVLSKQIFKVAGQPYNRSSDFFEENIRDYEYDATLEIAYEALNYNDTVLINAPFTREVRDNDYMRRLRANLAEKGIRLVLIWVRCDTETCRRRMAARNSDRDTWKLEHWDEYIAGCDFSVPEIAGEMQLDGDFIIVENSTDEEFACSLDETVAQLKAR